MTVVADKTKGYPRQVSESDSIATDGPADSESAGDSVDAVIHEKPPYSIVHEKADVLIARSTVSGIHRIPFRVTHSNNDSSHMSKAIICVCLWFYLFVYPHDYSKMNDPKVLQLDIGNDIGIAYGWCDFPVKRSQGHKVQKHIEGSPTKTA